MEKREVYELIDNCGKCAFGTDWLYAEYEEIQWDIEDSLEARRRSCIQDEGRPEERVDLECPIDSYETWYLINTKNKSIEMYTECSKSLSWFKNMLEDYDYLELYGYWAGDMIITKYKVK